jgi:hypothetical protein
MFHQILYIYIFIKVIDVHYLIFFLIEYNNPFPSITILHVNKNISNVK